MFDLRGGTYLHKLSGHTDVVSDVAFHPLYPEVSSGMTQRVLKAVPEELLTRILVMSQLHGFGNKAE